MKKLIVPIFSAILLFLSAGCTMIDFDSMIDVGGIGGIKLVVDVDATGLVSKYSVLWAQLSITDPTGKLQSTNWMVTSTNHQFTFQSTVPGLHYINLIDFDSLGNTNVFYTNVNFTAGHNYRLLVRLGADFIVDNSKYFGIYSETVPLGVDWGIPNVAMDTWSGAENTSDDTSTYSDGVRSLRIAPTGAGWWGIGIRPNPTNAYKDLSAYKNGSLKFSFKGTKPVKVGVKFGSSTETWILSPDIFNYGLKTNNTWCQVSIPLSNMTTNQACTNVSQYFMISADNTAAYGYVPGATVYNIDNIYWTVDPVYTVTYNSDGGSAVNPQMVSSPATTVGTLPTAPTKSGYTFGGWFTALNGGGTSFTATTTVNADITVYAYWIANTYTVTFDSQGATIAANPTSKTVTLPATTVGTLPTAPTKTGYTFSGWFTAVNGGGTAFTASTTVNADITVYAYWTANTYTVTFDSQGATVAANPTSIAVTSPATTVGTLPTAPTKTGYIFGGWFTAVNGGGTAFTASTTVSANITVYAYWISYTYTVTFDSQSATVPANPTSKTVTSPATTVGTLPTAPTKTGYTFGGWFTAVNGGGTAFNASTTVTGNITVYAYWSVNPVYTVTYDSQGATVAANPTSQTVTLPATTVGTLPTAPTKTGYIFGGWFTAVNGGGTAFTASTTVNANITVYAYWISYTYTVTFDSQGATVAANPTSKTVASPATTVVTLPTAPTKTGYIFGGWYTAVNGGGTSFTASTTVTGNITVYAYWISYTYTVTFDSQGATVAANPTSKTVASPATTVVTLPTAPTKTGYTFGGWYTAVNGGGTSFTASTTVSANITVYAYWIVNSYTVTYDSQGATVAANPTSQTVTSPATTVGTLPTAPTKTGYNFGGWFTAINGGGTAFTATTTVSANITVYAYWISTAATGPTFVIFSETASNHVTYDVDTKIDVWNGMTMADDTSTFGEGTKSWKLTGTDTNGGWMGFGIRVEPLNNYRNMSVFATGSFRFMFKGQKGFKLGLKTGAGTEAWLLPGQLMDYGLLTNNTWCTVSIPMSAFTGLDLTQMQSYLMFTADASTGYRIGDVMNIDNIYFTTTATTVAKKTFGLYTESYPQNVVWDTDATMEVWNGGFVLAPDTTVFGEGSVSLKLTATTATWGALSLRVNPTTAYKNLSTFVGGYLTFMYKSTKTITKVGVIDSLVPAGVYVTGATCVASYGMKTDGTWSKVTIPMSAFPGVTWSSIANYFVIVTDGANQVNGNVYNIDNIYYYK